MKQTKIFGLILSFLLLLLLLILGLFASLIRFQLCHRVVDR